MFHQIWVKRNQSLILKWCLLMKVHGLSQMMVKTLMHSLLKVKLPRMTKEMEKTLRSQRRERRENYQTFKQFRRETDLRNPQFRLGMQFTDREEVKEAIKEYAIVEGKSIKFVKNDNFRVKAKCVGHKYCPFVVLASRIDRNQPTFAIKTLSLEHECTRVDRLGYCNARWLSIRFADKIRKNLNWDVAAMQAEVQEQYAMNVSKHQIWRSKRLSRVVIEGSYLEQYTRLWDYAEQLKSSNKGSTVVIKNDMVRGELVFQRIYLCLAGCKKGFLEGCRSVIGVDGCHLKGPYTRQVLTAVGVDGNNGMFPIAYAIVEAENKSS
ncbi:unnamed protein product, partial [Prunus brigantina]